METINLENINEMENLKKIDLEIGIVLKLFVISTTLGALFGLYKVFNP